MSKSEAKRIEVQYERDIEVQEDDGPMVAALEFERDGEVIDTMKIDPPAGSFTRRMEKITRGVLTQAADDVLIFEIGVDGKRLD